MRVPGHARIRLRHATRCLLLVESVTLPSPPLLQCEGGEPCQTTADCKWDFFPPLCLAHLERQLHQPEVAQPGCASAVVAGPLVGVGAETPAACRPRGKAQPTLDACGPLSGARLPLLPGAQHAG